MITNTIRSLSNGNLVVQPTITFSGNKVTIGKTGFVVEGSPIELEDDTEFVMTQRPGPQVIQALLVLEKSTQKFLVVVDEAINDGSESLQNYGGTDYHPVVILFHAAVPANDPDFSNATVHISTVESRPPKPRRQPTAEASEG